MTVDIDRFLINRLKSDDEQAFEVLFKKYYKLSYGYARYYLDDADACHDVVQDMFGHVWEKRKELNIDGSFKSYLYVAIKNSCLNLIKKQNLKRRVASEIFDREHSPDDGYAVIFENEMKEKLNEIMEALPDQCRRIFILSRFEGLKHKEIAEKMGISYRTVETQIYRALKIFKKHLHSK